MTLYHYGLAIFLSSVLSHLVLLKVIGLHLQIYEKGGLVWNLWLLNRA